MQDGGDYLRVREMSIESVEEPRTGNDEVAMTYILAIIDIGETGFETRVQSSKLNRAANADADRTAKGTNGVQKCGSLGLKSCHHLYHTDCVYSKRLTMLLLSTDEIIATDHDQR